MENQRDNLRDHMTDLELIFTMLGEASTTEFARNRDAREFDENLDESVSPSRSKILIDAIDEEIGPKFKLTAEQIDTVINYDIKYRMGLNGGEVDADD